MPCPTRLTRITVDESSQQRAGNRTDWAKRHIVCFFPATDMPAPPLSIVNRRAGQRIKQAKNAVKKHISHARYFRELRPDHSLKNSSAHGPSRCALASTHAQGCQQLQTSTNTGSGTLNPPTSLEATSLCPPAASNDPELGREQPTCNASHYSRSELDTLELDRTIPLLPVPVPVPLTPASSWPSWAELDALLPQVCPNIAMLPLLVASTENGIPGVSSDYSRLVATKRPAQTSSAITSPELTPQGQATAKVTAVSPCPALGHPIQISRNEKHCRSVARAEVQGQSKPLADPIINALQFTPATAFKAALENALILHVDLATIRTPACSSPFYRPVAPQDDPQSLLASVSHPEIPAHLQPTLAQVLYPHHPFLDLLPFPLLRANAITMWTLMPHVFDLADFKNDIIFNGALVCWTSNSSFHPWDMRSWEAAPWFLEKWRMLLDGECGEIWQQSSWWWNMRGPSASRAF